MQNQADKFAQFAADVAQDRKFAAHVDWDMVAVGFNGQIEGPREARRYVFPDGSSARLTGNPDKPVSAYL